jgi:hypothetical protein
MKGRLRCMCLLSILVLGFTLSRSICAVLPVGFLGPRQNSFSLIGVTHTESFIPPDIAMIIDSQQLPWLIVATLLFALLALAMLFFYNYKIQSRSYSALERLGRLGKTVKVTSSAPFVRPDSDKESFRSAVPVLKIEGPGVVTVGVESAEFTATLGNEPSPPETKWTVTPATAATLSPNGSTVKVIATVAGAFTIAAEVSAASDANLSPEARTVLRPEVIAGLKPPASVRGELQVAAISQEAEAIELPFIGGGYGSIAMAIILVAAVIILGMAGVLGGESVATLLGGLLGYIFGVAVPPAASAAGKKNGAHVP